MRPPTFRRYSDIVHRHVLPELGNVPRGKLVVAGDGDRSALVRDVPLGDLYVEVKREVC